MKKLCKLQFNAEKLIKNEELMVLRGGYGDSFCGCRDDEGQTICSDWVVTCDFCRNYCNNMCPEWTNLICVGW